MANLVFLPVADKIRDGSYLLYDGACGTGGMLTVAEETLNELTDKRGRQVVTHLYGQEVNPETYAICKADMLLKGEGKNADHIVGGAEHSTLAHDAFRAMEFDFMLSNPPYGKSWKKDLEAMGGKESMRDPRFRVTHKYEHRKGKVQLIDATEWFRPLRKNLGKKNCELSEEDIKRICDTYLAFTGTEQSKIFPNEHFGHHKVTVERPLRLHGRFTRKAIESLRFASGDEESRAELYKEFGDALFTDFRGIEKNLATKLAEWGSEDEENNGENESSANKGLPEKKKKKLLDEKTWMRDNGLMQTAEAPMKEVGGELFEDHNVFRATVEAALKKLERKVSSSDLKVILRAVSRREETAPPVIAKIHKPGKLKADPLHGLYEARIDGKRWIVEYEPDPDLRDTEQIPLLEPGGVEAFIEREVLPYTPDAWIDDSKTKTGYEISFTRHFYKPKPLRTLEEIRADILAVEKEAEGLLDELLLK